MSETRSSVSDDHVSVALSKFGGAQSRGTGSVKRPSEAQTESKRNASKRQAILKNPNTPQGIKVKWKQICSLSSRNNSKNSKKQEFTKILFKDQNNSETDHGGPVAGKAAVDAVVAAGLFEERVIFGGRDKDGKPVRISQIRVKSRRARRATRSLCPTVKLWQQSRAALISQRLRLASNSFSQPMRLSRARRRKEWRARPTARRG